MRGETALARFRRSLEAAPSWRNVEGLDLGALRQLTGDERCTAEELLLARVEARDGRVLDALALVGGARAVAALRTAVRSWPAGAARNAAASALEALMGDGEGTAALIGGLGHDHWSDRADAAARLRRLPGPDVRAALAGALEDRDPVVRVSAFQGLLGHAGVEDPETTTGAIAALRRQVAGDDPALRATAIAAVHQLLDGRSS